MIVYYECVCSNDAHLGAGCVWLCVCIEWCVYVYGCVQGDLCGIGVCAGVFLWVCVWVLGASIWVWV